jgi:hypothetical protein
LPTGITGWYNLKADCNSCGGALIYKPLGLNRNNLQFDTAMNEAIKAYNEAQSPGDKAICDQLAAIINRELTEAVSKIWHAHPVWFLNDNPVVGYSKQKAGIRLMFWSGASFEEEGLNVIGNKFKDAGSKNQEKFSGIIKI